MTNSISPILPIDLSDGLFLSPKIAREIGESFSADYCFSEPYPHIIFDNFLPQPLIDEILKNFPNENSSANDVVFKSGYGGHNKRQIHPISCSARVRMFFDFFNSPPFLQFLEGLTTIPAIIPDPYFSGGGFHEISEGGKLGIHADFRINEQLNLNRRLNVLIYLNPNWNIEYGGNLEIWDSGMSNMVKSIAPILNRCVIFSTDEKSFHGHPDPLTTTDGITRKSLALYYYTASTKIYEELPLHSTMYKARPTDPSSITAEAKKLNLHNYKRDWLPPAVLNPRLLLPPTIFRALKKILKLVK